MRLLLAEAGYPEGTDAQTVHWIISHPEMEILVGADSHDRPIGVLALSHRPQLRLRARIVTVDELVVTEVWRRRGVGRELMRRALDRAKVLSAKGFEIYARSGEEAAAFLEACGLVRRSSQAFDAPGMDRR
ncbi:MAG: GNAT family N-acetyltransferase [Myxococcales bacterium]|nr:GNAT family N-acetyltransferase [Myxococcales bacterium]